MNAVGVLGVHPSLHVEEIGEDLGYFYLEIYCGPKDYDGSMIVLGDHQYQRNNQTLRRALAYALNYIYIIEEIQQGKACYVVPAVPRSMPGPVSGARRYLLWSYPGCRRWSRLS